MSKKHKKKFTHHKPQTANTPSSTAASNAESVDTVATTPSPVVPMVSQNSSHSNIIAFKELRTIALIFALLLILLASVVVINTKTDYLTNISDSLSKLLHIEE